MAPPPFTFERNTLGSNGSFALRFIAGPPYREGYPLGAAVNVSPAEWFAIRTVRSGSSRPSRTVSTRSSGATSLTAASCAPSDEGAHPRQQEYDPAGEAVSVSALNSKSD